MYCQKPIGLRSTVWAANGVHCSNGFDVGVHFGFVQILHVKESPLLSHIYMGRSLDEFILHVAWPGRVKPAYPLLYKIHRRSVQRAPECEFHLRSPCLFEAKLPTSGSE